MESEFTGKRVTVVGLGRSAAGAARLLLEAGARPFVSDAADNVSQAPWRAELERLGVPYETGGHSPRALEECDALVMSPGVPPGADAFTRAVSRGVPVISELELGFLHTRARIIAVTGTNGKTTTTELLRALIAACGEDVVLAGNNDYPLSLAAVERPAAQYAVVEVSSYQLETCRRFRPWLAAILNLTPDHLGRHKTMEGYAAAKARIFAQQGPGDGALVNADDPWKARYPVPPGVRRLEFSIQREVEDGLWSDGDGILEGRARVARAADVPIPGKHNLANALAALTLMRAGGFDWDATLRGLHAFRAVEHRIELCGEIDGARYYNDSKSTNIDSLRVALESFTVPVVLIAGGRGKGSPYGELEPVVRAHVKHLVTLGEDAPLLEAAFAALQPTERAASMRDAVRLARAAASPGDAVLLSPGCASFDMYSNFEERGRDFKAEVRALAAAPEESLA